MVLLVVVTVFFLNYWVTGEFIRISMDNIIMIFEREVQTSIEVHNDNNKTTIFPGSK